MLPFPAIYGKDFPGLDKASANRGARLLRRTVRRGDDRLRYGERGILLAMKNGTMREITL